MSNTSLIDQTIDISQDGFCGKAPFWDAEAFWNDTRPEISPCFARVIWSLVPAIFFWIFAPIIFLCSANFAHNQPSLPLGAINLSKTIISGLLVVVTIVDLVFFAITDELNPARILDSCLRIVTFIAVIVLIQLQRRRGVRASGLQWHFWLLFSGTSVILLYSIILNRVENIEPAFPTLLFVTHCISVALIFIEFLLNFLTEPRSDYNEPQERGSKRCPLLDASFPSKLTFSWFTSLAWTGFKRDITSADLWALIPSLTTVFNWSRFEKRLHQHLTKDGDATFNHADNSLNVKIKEVPKSAGFLTPLAKTFGLSFFLGSILKLIHDMMVFIAPYILKLIINFAHGDEPLWLGVAYAILLFLTSTTQTLFLSQYFYRMYKIGLQTRTTLIRLVYKKSLRTTVTSTDNSSTGEYVNLMSVDIQRIVDLMPYVNMAWSSPLQIIAAIFFLWQQLGPSVLAGLFLMILLIPVNGAIAAKARQLQIKQMKQKDERVKMMNEILQGMKILKLYAWEESFEETVNKIRSKEIEILKQMGYLQGGTSFVWACAPFLVSLVTFATYVLVDENNVLNSEKAFVSLSLFNILRFPMSMLPMMISMLVQASVSVKRINKFLRNEEISSDIDHDSSTDEQNYSVETKDANFAWHENQAAPTLKDLNIKVKTGSLVAIVGKVGAGKSSLLSSLLGELKKLSGIVTTRGNVAFCPQQAWVQNATLKQNILFGRGLDAVRYGKALDACALKSDLDVLPGGDETEIGEKGINLSGGQKQRISLARAVYSQSDLYLLDDPLSAVDSHVGKHIFENVIGPKGCLAGTTRLLVTHGITFLPQVDNILVIKDGAVSESGTYKELLAKKGEFAEILVQFISEQMEEGDEEEENEMQDLKNTLEQTMGKEQFERTLSRYRSESEAAPDDEAGYGSHNSSKRSSKVDLSASTDSSSSPKKRAKDRKASHEFAERKGSRGSAKSNNLGSNGEEKQINGHTKGDQKNLKQYQEEKAETGKVNFRVYLYYFYNMGLPVVITCIMCYVGYQVCSAYSSIWLSDWADHNRQANHTTAVRDKYLTGYGLFGLGQGIFAVAGSVFLYFSTLRGSERLHQLVLKNVMHSPMLFFDTTPQGRILNRFSKDIDVLDATMPMILRGWITCLLAVTATFLIISYTTPLFMAPTFVVLCFYYFVQRVYVASSRQLKRLESISRSPIYSHFGETISGVQTIRAYHLEEQFLQESERRVDENQMASYPSIVANRWLAVRLETVGNIIIFCSALFAVLGRDEISPGLVGLSVSYALSVTQALNWLVRMASEVETNIVAVERLKEYAEVQQEANWHRDDPEAKPFNPVKGKIEFRKYSTKYREGLPLALSGVSFEVNGGERVGIVGRTGAGKSSLTLALFRLIEPVDGQILIDDTDIFSLGLHELRSKLSIIPQDPVLFSGTLRENLDPFNQHSDEEVIRSLNHAHLGHFLKTLDDGLSHKIAEGGANISVGQRQLVCLARALLRKSKILVLDEATAAVDMETDEIIQKTIREEFIDTTIITIAHRLKTIMDYNKIIVLANGSVVEEGHPSKLLEDKTSKFYVMCAEASLV